MRPLKLVASDVSSSGTYLVFRQVANDKYNDGTVGFVEFNLARPGHRQTVIAHNFGGDLTDSYRIRQFAVSERGFIAWQAVQFGTTQPFGAIMARGSHGICTIASGPPAAFTGPLVRGDTIIWTMNRVAMSAPFC